MYGSGERAPLSTSNISCLQWTNLHYINLLYRHVCCHVVCKLIMVVYNNNVEYKGLHWTILYGHMTLHVRNAYDK